MIPGLVLALCFLAVFVGVYWFIFSYLWRNISHRR